MATLGKDTLPSLATHPLSLDILRIHIIVVHLDTQQVGDLQASHHTLAHRHQATQARGATRAAIQELSQEATLLRVFRQADSQSWMRDMAATLQKVLHSHLGGLKAIATELPS